MYMKVVQIAEWYVHKDLCNKTVKVRSQVQSLLMPPAVTSLCSPKS